jgi:hypothetical protein
MRLLIASFVLAVVGLAPATAQFGRAFDFTGVWKLEGGESKGENYLDLTMKDKSLTGKLKTPTGEFPIENGSVEGQDLFFNVVIKRDEYALKTSYRGHLFSDEIQFTVEAGERMLQVIAKKATK